MKDSIRNTFLLIGLLSIIRFSVSANEDGAVDNKPNFQFNFGNSAPTTSSLKLTYVPESGYGFDLQIGGQKLFLLISSTVHGIVLFQDGTSACDNTGHCYIPDASKTASWCNNGDVCDVGKVDYVCKEIDDHDNVFPTTTTIMKVNSNVVILHTIEGNESVSILSSDTKQHFSFFKAPIKMVKPFSKDNEKTFFKNASGLFGIVNSDMGCRNYSIWQEILKPFNGIYSIDINDTGENQLKLGLDPSDYKRIMWSEKVQTGGVYNNSLVEFSLYHLSLCDVEIFGKVSCYWEAIIDMNSEYLILPKIFWTSMMLHLPIDRECMTYGASSRFCKIKPDINGPLPALEFKLSDNVNGPRLTIPLEHLTIEKDGDRYLGILPDENKVDRVGFSFVPTIKIGYRVLPTFNIVVDTERHKVGFIPKKSGEYNNNSCTPKVTCRGDQVYEPALNLCIDPFCSVWLFKRLNRETRQVYQCNLLKS
ncbi:Aspartic peptidase domain superfamily [Babesia duncani]|uniref:Aspartic peptidase domain superfamily n=1 Tax=Babesia duncani TaxID=323732 RepID=A0AAD9PJ99_9APIC|nr:Aspartic peptidase domain superfamily [Babesia duncani]